MEANTAFADYTTGISKKAGIEVGYYFANCATQQLQKPIIIVDGFDPGDDRRITGIYDQLYYNNGSNNLGQEMRLAGYDVLVVNFPTIIETFRPFPFNTEPEVTRDGGADYIERNAFAIVKLIDSVNLVLAANGSTEKLVVIGPSMGGLITRYALAYMEKNGMNHNTRLWTSFDSPHWGANIPIGDQWWLEYYSRVGGKDDAKASLENQIGSVAARQMLIHHYSANSLAPAPNAYRTLFMQNLQSNGVTGSSGFPQNLRRISLANGAGNGVVQPQGAAGGKVLELDAYIRVWAISVFGIFTSAILRQHITESNIYFTPDYGNTGKIFDGWYRIKRWDAKRYEEKFAQTPLTTKSYDRVPGGKYNTQAVIKKQGQLTGIENVFANAIFSNVINDHSFIPTVSALALTNQQSRDWSENLSTRNLVCSGETPFNAYYTPATNEDHVLLTADNVAWVKGEIYSQQPTNLSGYYSISSNYHNPGYQYPLGPNNSIFLPANQNLV